MPEGDRKLVFISPPVGQQDAYGQPTAGVSKEYVVYARRQDRTGREGVEAETEVGEWQTVFIIRQDPRFDLTIDWSGWQIRDELGRTCGIESVMEPPYGRRRYWSIVCKAWDAPVEEAAAPETPLDPSIPVSTETNRILDGDDNFITDGQGKRLVYA